MSISSNKSFKVILCRHLGYVGTRGNVSDFALKKLKPIVEFAMGRGGNVQLIHNQIPVLNIRNNLPPSVFENSLKNRKRVREWKEHAKRWRLNAQQGLKDADKGKSSPFLDGDFPEFSYSLEMNQKSPGSIIHNLNFCPFDAKVEMTLAKLHYFAAQRAVDNGDFGEAMMNIKEANDAKASSILLKNEEMMKQLKNWSKEGDSVVLGSLEEIMLPSMLREHGIRAEEHIENVILNFREVAINSLLKRNFDNLYDLALLDLIFTKEMGRNDFDWSKEDDVEKCFKITLEEWHEIREKYAKITNGQNSISEENKK